MACTKKRKHSSSPTPQSMSESTHSLRRLRRRPHTPEADNDKPFPFLQLAPELRNLVYEKALEDDGVIQLSRKTSKYKRKTTSTSNLSLVNKQIREEYLSTALVSAPIIKTRVLNFDFGNLITFLNRLSDVELDRMVMQNGRPAERRMVVEFIFDGLPSDEVFFPICYLKPLRRWVQRMKHPNKRGTNIQCEYSCANATHASDWYWAQWRIPSGKPRTEFQKIMHALQMARSEWQP